MSLVFLFFCEATARTVQLYKNSCTLPVAASPKIVTIQFVSFD